jgi:hypothetical protein
MTAFDYFLYDNRTPSIDSGSDWAIKADTGVLAGRKDLRVAFHDYCRLTHGDDGRHPRGFDAAIGGLNAAGGGYLLCVTLETPDRFTRPSLAVVGLWCPDRDALDALITQGDPIETARPMLKLGRALASLEMRGTSRRGRARTLPDKTAYLRFQQGESPELALSMLDPAASGSSLPAILGITGSSKLTDAGKKFRVIFSQPTDALAEEVLSRLEASPSALAERELPVIVESARTPIVGRGPDAPNLPMAAEPATPRARGRRRPPEVTTSPQQTRRAKRWVMPAVIVTSVIVTTAVTVPFVIDGQPGMRGNQQPPEQAANAATGQPPETPPDRVNPREALERSLIALKALQPTELRKSPGFLAAEQVDVVPEHSDARQEVLRAYTVLLENQLHLTSPGFRDSLDFALTGKIANAPDKESRIAQLRESAAVGAPACQILRGAFGEELSSPASVAHKWCDAFQSLNEAVQSLDLDGPRGS